jgi:hypothetical protein
MKALAYLVIIQWKNRILSLKKKPAFLILYGFILAMVLFSVVMLIIFGKDINKSDYADERILFLIIAGFGLLFLYAFTTTGLSTGSSLFTMPDVGLLFVAPISSKKILMYGLLSTLGKALLGSIFIFYQIGNLKANFGYGITEIVALFLLFALMVLYCQLLSIGIYIFSNSNPGRKNIVKMILYTAIGALLLATVLLQRQEQISMIEAVFRVTSSGWFGYLPVAGWAVMFFAGVIHGSLISIIIPLLLFFTTGILVIMLLTAGKADYYEDVLLSTELTFQQRRAAKEGSNIPRAGNQKIKVRDKEMGIAHGKGAMTFLYKHILEMRRKSRLIFIDSFTIFMIIGLGIAGYNFKLKAAPDAVNYSALATVNYFQYFLTMMGKLRGELLKPYIYLMPEKSIKKVFAASLTSLIKPCIDGFLMFTVFAAVSNVNPLDCFFFALAYSASGAVFVGLTILYQRVLGGQPNKVIQMFLGIGLLFSVMAPSIGASIAAAFLLPESLDFLCTLPYTLFCLLFAVILFAANGNLIDKAEYTGKM